MAGPAPGAAAAAPPAKDGNTTGSAIAPMTAPVTPHKTTGTTVFAGGMLRSALAGAADTSPAATVQASIEPRRLVRMRIPVTSVSAIL